MGACYEVIPKAFNPIEAGRAVRLQVVQHMLISWSVMLSLSAGWRRSSSTPVQVSVFLLFEVLASALRPSHLRNLHLPFMLHLPFLQV